MMFVPKFIFWTLFLTFLTNQPTRAKNLNDKTPKNCPSHLSFNTITNSCIDQETSARIKKRPACKNITITINSYTITHNQLHLKTPTTDQNFTEYTELNNGTARICYPFTPTFRSCARWEINANEFTLENDGLTLKTDTGLLLNPGDFVMVDQETAHVCMTEFNKTIRHRNLTNTYITTWLISAISIFFSIIIYATISWKKMTYHTKTVMCHMLSLLIFYVLLIIKASGPVLEPDVCVIYAGLVHYFFLASFFWINVLAIDIWKYLPGFTSTDGSRKKSRFVFMSLYAWGVPGILSGFALLVNQLAPKFSAFRPQFEAQCWFMEMEAKVLFLYGPASLILGANVVFFVLTVWSLRQLGKDIVMVNKTIHKKLLRLYVKLLIVMGLCWIMEIVSGIVNRGERYWHFTDIINGLQGFFLFLVYVCKGSVLRDLVNIWVKYVGYGNCIGDKIAMIHRRFSIRSSRMSSSNCPEHQSCLHSVVPDSSNAMIPKDE